MLKGLDIRLRSELCHITTINMADNMTDSISVKSVPEREFLVWCGGAALASMKSFENAWISSDEYFECGVDIVHRKCFWILNNAKRDEIRTLYSRYAYKHSVLFCLLKDTFTLFISFLIFRIGYNYLFYGIKKPSVQSSWKYCLIQVIFQGIFIAILSEPSSAASPRLQILRQKIFGNVSALD